MMPQLNDFLEQSGMSLPEALVKRDEEVKVEPPVLQEQSNGHDKSEDKGKVSKK